MNEQPFAGISGLLVSESQLEQVAATFAQALLVAKSAKEKALGAIHIEFHGDLGAGKTTFVRAMLRACGMQGVVKSPTYTLVEQYDCSLGKVAHFDLYRLNDPSELEFVGFRDILDQAAVLLVEWPERALGELPQMHWQVRLEHAGEQRSLSIIKLR